MYVCAFTPGYLDETRRAVSLQLVRIITRGSKTRDVCEKHEAAPPSLGLFTTRGEERGEERGAESGKERDGEQEQREG